MGFDRRAYSIPFLCFPVCHQKRESRLFPHGGSEEEGMRVTWSDPACLDISSVPVRMYNQHHINSHAESLPCT